MVDARSLAIPALVTLQALAVHWVGGREILPTAPAIDQFPSDFGNWKKAGENPIAADVARELGADRVLSRTYLDKPDLDKSSVRSVDLFVAWFQSQRGGARQPHSPKVCLPAAGWIPGLTGEMDLDTVAGAIHVNRYSITKGDERAIILYWYQTPRRVVAGEWEAKFWVVVDGIRDRRTDTSLVRVITWVTGSDDREAAAAAVAFARDFYPLWRERLLQP